MASPSYLENVLFDDIKLGQSASLTRTLTTKDIEVFAAASGDVNPFHLDNVFAAKTRFKGVVGHGMWTGALISCLLGDILPGPGTIFLEQNIKFKNPVRPQDTVTVTITVREKRADKPIVFFDCVCINQKGETIAIGSSTVIAPTERIRHVRPFYRIWKCLNTLFITRSSQAPKN